ncbi:MAG TPA: hypothetical protein VM820_01525 [Vicinamibacterales bacterium]|jgi:hypothetical protein|nr:hypothetical protein [Vicinamibacterales bacterium]
MTSGFSRLFLALILGNVVPDSMNRQDVIAGVQATHAPDDEVPDA